MSENYAALYRCVNGSGRDWSGIDLSKRFEGLLNESSFDEATLTRSNLKETDLENTTFRGSDMTEVKLERAYLGGTDFTGAILKGANLRGAGMSGTTFVRANVDGADFTGAKMSNKQVRHIRTCALNVDGAIGLPLESPEPPEVKSKVREFIISRLSRWSRNRNS